MFLILLVDPLYLVQLLLLYFDPPTLVGCTERPTLEHHVLILFGYPQLMGPASGHHRCGLVVWIRYRQILNSVQIRVGQSCDLISSVSWRLKNHRVRHGCTSILRPSWRQMRVWILRLLRARLDLSKGLSAISKSSLLHLRAR
jgi:hypothetical protein